MALDPHLWALLEQCGLVNAQLEMLVRLCQTARNGSCTWDVHEGRIRQCDLRLVVPSRPAELQRVCELVFPEVPSPENGRRRP